MWQTYGDYLKASRLTNALTEAAIAFSGTTDSFLKVSHLTRTRHAHQVTVLALAKLQDDASCALKDHTMMKLRMHGGRKWCRRAQLSSTGIQFSTWNSWAYFSSGHIMREFLLCSYVESLKALVPWFFALEHHNYACWIPVHIRDMESLPAPILQEFEEHSNWVIRKTMNRFSTIPIDQAHGQNIEVVKGSGGAVGLTENPSAFRSQGLNKRGCWRSLKTTTSHKQKTHSMVVILKKDCVLKKLSKSRLQVWFRSSLEALSLMIVTSCWH